jgi:AmmeMemoRadiSam system protein B
MPEVLPALRRGLDLMPSPLAERPGLLIRDPFRYAEAILILPPPLVPLLGLFDGQCPVAEARAAVVRAAGDVRAGEVVDHLHEALSQAGFLHDPAFATRRDQAHRAFAAAPHRAALHAGGAYPDEPGALRETLERYLGVPADGTAEDGVLGIAAPHVSPEGGWRSYREAFRALGPEHRDKVFLVLGTSHYGEPEAFGLTRKPFLTPLGQAGVATALVDELAERGGPAARMEDYCHAVEHSIEFQVVFLQHLYGPQVRVLPVLCGPFARSTAQGGRPEDDDGVRRFLDALAALAAREAAGLVWVMGVDMAHMGRRYGDDFAARADKEGMIGVSDRDRARCERILAGDAHGFWSLVQENADDLKWCGASPLYAFLYAAGPVRGQLLRYEQWNIDDESVVSFAGMAFRKGE